MPVPLTCTGCDASLHIPDEFAGKKVKCPQCAAVLLVPLPGPTETADERIVEAPEFAGNDRPRGIREGHGDEKKRERKPPRGRPRGEGDEDDRPRGGKGGFHYKPCPKCGCEEATRVIWTAWGSFYGPALFTHVRCADCGHKYNGKTGRSNAIPAVIFVTIPLLGILGILAGIGYMIYTRM